MTKEEFEKKIQFLIDHKYELEINYAHGLDYTWKCRLFNPPPTSPFSWIEGTGLTMYKAFENAYKQFEQKV